MISITLHKVPVAPHGGECWEFIVDDSLPRTDLLISSVRVEKVTEDHSLIRYWNRGRGTSGEWQVVKTSDALAIIARLFGLTLTEFANGVAFSIKNTFKGPLG